jgi:hypothetical protein
MPAKTISATFKLDIKDFINLVVKKNMAVDIHVTGTKRQEPEPIVTLPAQQVFALPAPHPIAGERKSPHGRMGSKAAVLFYIAQNKRATAAQLKEALEEAGYSKKTYNGLMFNMQREKLVAKSAQGYRILNAGLKKLDTVGDE